MPTQRFMLAVHPDSAGRTCVTVTEPCGDVRDPVVLGLQGERALYAFMAYVRAADASGPLDLLETWEREPGTQAERTSPWQCVPPDDLGRALDPRRIELEIARCGI